MYVNLVVVVVNGSKQMGLESIPAKMIVESLVFILHYCFVHVYHKKKISLFFCCFVCLTFSFF